MKRKILCLVLCLMILPSIFIFSACNKDTGYDLANLKQDYVDSFSRFDVVKLEEGELGYEITINLDDYPDFKQAITMSPYNSFNDYKYILGNMTIFINDYIDTVSTAPNDADAIRRNDVSNKLADVQLSLKNLNSQIKIMGDMCRSYNYQTDDRCVTRYNYLLDAFVGLFQSYYNFSNAIGDVYFEGMDNLMTNYYGTNIENFDVAMAVVNLHIDAYTKSHIVDITHYFVETNLDGNVDSGLTSNFNTYKSNVDRVNKTITQTDIESIIANESKVRSFYDNCIKFYNIQRTFRNDKAMFVNASNSIQTAGLSKSENLTSAEKMHLAIVNEYGELVSEYNNVLASLLSVV